MKVFIYSVGICRKLVSDGEHISSRCIVSLFNAKKYAKLKAGLTYRLIKLKPRASRLEGPRGSGFVLTKFSKKFYFQS